MSLRFSTKRRGTLLRKSNSAPSLLSLIVNEEAGENSGLEFSGFGHVSGVDTSEAGWHQSPMDTEPRETSRSGLRHVDSMELIVKRLDCDKKEASHSLTRHQYTLQPDAGRPQRMCSLPHVDSCELICHLTGKYEEEDFITEVLNSEDLPAGTQSNNFAHMPQLPACRKGALGSPFDHAINGI